MTSDSRGLYQGFLQQTGEAVPVSMVSSYPMMVRRKPFLAKKSQYLLIRDDALKNLLGYICINFQALSNFNSVNILAVSDHVSTIVICPINSWLKDGPSEMGVVKYDFVNLGTIV